MAARESAYWQQHKAALIAFGDAGRGTGATDWAAWCRQYPGPTPTAAQLKYNRLRREVGLEPPTPDTPALPPVDPVEAEQRRQESLRGRRQELAELKSLAGERAFRSFLEKLVQETAQEFPPVRPHALKTPRGDTTTETVVQAFSDWHAYEVVDKERTRDFNEYNALIMGQRVRAVVERHLSIKARLERGGGWRFPRLVVGANGDFVSGTIHEVERHSDAPSVVHAVYGTGLVLAQALRDLAAAYPEVEVFGSYGNHGRLPDARRMQQKDPMRSWDALIYLFAREHLRGVPNIRWHLPNSYSVAFDVEGWRFLQTHGHDVKSWNSIPHYGINRLVNNLNALESARATPIHYFLLGHFHNKTSLEHAAGEWFLNGSLIGATEFGINALGKADKPCQWMLGVHPEHGVTHRWPILGATQPDAPAYDVQPWVEAA